MRTPSAVAFGALALALYLVARDTLAADPGPAPLAGDGMTNLDAFLRMIRQHESGNDYSIMWGGSHFAGFADHPRILNEYAGRRSTAAGAYQIIAGTWDTVVQPAMNLPDFSPASQDAAAVYLIQRRGAMSDVLAGDFAAAVAALKPEWEALAVNPIDQLASAYTAAGGALA